MDEESRRSFFYVGDTKQAIYSWRGGNAELFREFSIIMKTFRKAMP